MSVENPINFPNSPTNGQNYDFQGIRYTWKATNGSGASGFWQVVAPYTYGAASEVEVNEGTSSEKFITPRALAESEYRLNATRNNELDTRSANTLYKDNISALFGTDSDAYLKHTGSNMLFVNGTGNLDLSSPKVRLLNSGSMKLETNSSGVNVSGTLSANTLSSTNLTTTGTYTAKTINSSGTVTAATLKTTGKLLVSDGTAASPAMYFSSDPDTGIYKVNSNTIGFSTGGVRRAYVSSSGIVSDSNVTATGYVTAKSSSTKDAPTYRFSSQSGTGIFSGSTNTMGFSVGGGVAISISTSKVEISKTLKVGSNEFVQSGLNYLSATRYGAGSSEAPSIRFSSSTKTGGIYEYFDPDNTIDLSRGVGIASNGRETAYFVKEEVRFNTATRIITNISGTRGALDVSGNNIGGIYSGVGVLAASDSISIYEGENKSGTTTFRVVGTGNVTNTNNSYGSISDRRKKQDIVDAKSQWNDIKLVKLHNYRMKDQVKEEGDKAITHLGVIAQELQEDGLGKLVSEDTDGTLTVKTSVLYMKALGALREALVRIEDLERKVKDMDNLVSESLNDIYIKLQ
jgi:hypothetical protein